MEMCSFVIYALAVFYLLQAAGIFAGLTFQVPHTQIVYLQIASQRANIALEYGNIVLNWCYVGFIIFIGISILFSSMCCIFKRKLSFSFYFLIPALVMLPDVYFVFAQGDYVSLLLHLVMAVAPIFAMPPLKKYQKLKEQIWGERF